MKEYIRKIIEEVGEDPDREGLVGTPDRVARAYGELLEGYRTDPIKLVNNATFSAEYDDMVIVRDIEFYSLCEHHMLPFIGRAHIAYLPKGQVIGLSKIPRIVDIFARRLQNQERLTFQIAGSLDKLLKPKGVGVILEAKHLCMMSRGVMKQKSMMTTSAVRGLFKKNLNTRSEFLKLIGNHG